MFVVPGAPAFPSGVVRVEAYLPRIRAAGHRTLVLNYFSMRERRLAAHLNGPGTQLPRPIRTVAKAAVRAFRDLHAFARDVQVAVLALRADAVVYQWMPPPRWLSRWIAAVNGRLVFDFDDAVFVNHPARTHAVATRAWRVVAGSHALADYALARNTATVLIPSAVDADALAPRTDAGAAARRGPVRIGWIGSAGTLRYLAELVDPLARLADEGADFEFHVVGTQGRRDLLPEFPANVRVVEVEHYTAADLPELTARLDIGVMPLTDGVWERSKCAMKLLLYMAGARPAVCSRVGENAYVVDDGATGFQAASADEWTRRLRTLVDDAVLRARMGAAGRRVVVERYSLDVCFAALDASIFAALRAGSAAQAGAVSAPE